MGVNVVLRGRRRRHSGGDSSGSKGNIRAIPADGNGLLQIVTLVRPSDHLWLRKGVNNSGAGQQHFFNVGNRPRVAFAEVLVALGAGPLLLRVGPSAHHERSAGEGCSGG